MALRETITASALLASLRLSIVEEASIAQALFEHRIPVEIWHTLNLLVDENLAATFDVVSWRTADYVENKVLGKNVQFTLENGQ